MKGITFNFDEPMHLRYRFPSDRERFMRAAMHAAMRVRVEELDCRVCMTRRPSKRPVEDVLQECLSDSHSHWTVIVRNSVILNEPYLEVSVATVGKIPEYFIWADVDWLAGMELVANYNLQPA